LLLVSTFPFLLVVNSPTFIRKNVTHAGEFGSPTYPCVTTPRSVSLGRLALEQPLSSISVQKPPSESRAADPQRGYLYSEAFVL
jgi:hypothetical protein